MSQRLSEESNNDAKQIAELHDLCLQINLFAEKHKRAPIAMYHLIGDENPFTAMICIEICQTEPFDIIKTFTLQRTPFDRRCKGRYYRLVRKYLKDLVEKNVEVKENE